MRLGIKELLNRSVQKVKQRLGLQTLKWGDYLSKLDEALSGIWPTGTTQIVENGTYNVRESEYVEVNVPQDPILTQIEVTKKLRNGAEVRNFFAPYIEDGQTGFFMRRQDISFGSYKVIAIYFINGVIKYNGILRWQNSYSYSLCEISQSYTANIEQGSIFEKVVTDGPHITT